MAQPTEQEIEKFLHHQVECWNARDRDGFFNAYRNMAKGKFVIEYVGRPVAEDAWKILEKMWEQTNAIVDIEVVKTILNGNEAACHHINKMASKNLHIHTVELYKFDGDNLYIRYFTKPEPVPA